MTAVHHQPASADRRGRRGVLGHQLAGRNADAVVQRRHIDHIRRVHVGLQVRSAQLVGQGMRVWTGPALRIREEELHCRGVALCSHIYRIVVADMGTDVHIRSLDGASRTDRRTRTVHGECAA
jgi:hypothetical protein